MFDITLADGVLYSFIVVVVAIVIDTVLGAIKAAKDDFDSFDFRQLPKFLSTGILPYVAAWGFWPWLRSLWENLIQHCFMLLPLR